MEYFHIVISQIIIFVIYAVIGVIAVKTKLLDEAGLDVISRLVIKITLPIMIFHNTLTGATVEQFMHTTSVIWLTAVMYASMYVVSFGLKKLFRLTGDRGKVFHANTMFGNIGFMGIPILAAFFPENGMLYIALFTVVDQLVLWTVGVQLTLPEGGDGMPEEHGEKQPFFRKTVEKLVNPATIAITLAVIGIFADVKLPDELDVALGKVGGITSPLAMIYIGALFCYTDIKGSLKQKEFYGTVLVKMILYPIAFYVLMGLFSGVNQDVRLAMAILSALPTMTSIAMLAKSQKSDGEYSAGGVFVTTLCSVVTLPLVCYVLAVL
ncbi:MAG: AEC family transporter [Bacteroidales bacterium]|nr:AEC family transporter [Clostridium sp.]MCM1203734.1 AEC family transporter [Bacteroidales bacterium]